MYQDPSNSQPYRGASPQPPQAPQPPQGPEGPYGARGPYGSQGPYGPGVYGTGAHGPGAVGAGAVGPGAAGSGVGAPGAGVYGSGAGGYGAGSGAPASAPVKPKRRIGLIIGGVVALLLAVACVGGGYLASQDEPARAKVGDCVSQTGEDDLDIVECGSADAAYKVVGRLEDKTQTEAQLSACSAYVSAGASAVYWEGRAGEPGTVLCLAKTS